MIATQLKRSARTAIAHVLYHLGVLRLMQAIVLHRKAVVLMYHRVLTEEERARTGSHPGIVVSRDTFARQVAVLKRRFLVLSVGEFAERLAGRLPFSNSSCLITFDDGWIDNFTNALPILREHGLGAVIFLPVNYIGRDRTFWREALTIMLSRALTDVRQNPARRPRFRGLLEGVDLAHVLEIADADPRAAISEALAGLKEMDPVAIEALTATLAAELGVRIADLSVSDGFMDWRQVETMSANGVTFGGHGAEHRLLTKLSADEVEAEIGAAKTGIAESFTGSVPTFSYPNGSWTPGIAARVRDSGYRLAFTTVSGTVSRGDDPFTLRRVNIHEDATDTTPMFLARIVGLF